MWEPYRAPNNSLDIPDKELMVAEQPAAFTKVAPENNDDNKACQRNIILNWI